MEDTATGDKRIRSTSRRLMSECSNEAFEKIEMTQLSENSPSFNSVPDANNECLHEGKAHGHAGLMEGARHFAGKVKAAVVGLVTNSGTPTADGEQNFTNVCKELHKMLTKLHKKYGKTVVSEELMQEIDNTYEMVNRKEICISVFGQHNCGKSTQLNSLLGDVILPPCLFNETSVKVKVQHDSSVHKGICTTNCPKKQLKICPRLEVHSSDKETHYGPNEICCYLKDLNRKVRYREIEVPPKHVILKVHIPMLANKVLSGWTVNLVDNPGFGEASEHVSQLAEASMLTSSAYIYLMQTEHIGGKEVAEFFKELAAKDETALSDGRLTIGITKYDTNYTRIMQTDCGCDEMSVDDVKMNIIYSIKKETGVEVTKDTIIPLCGLWALTGSKLASCLVFDPENKRKRLTEDAVRVLESHPDFSVPCGEGQKQIDAIRDQDPTDIAVAIEDLAGICHLKNRVHYVVGKACVKVWATKILSEFQHSLESAEGAIQSRCEAITSEHTDMLVCYGRGMEQSKLISEMIDSIQAAAPKRKRKTSRIWCDFEVAYDEDVKHSNPQERGKEQVKLLVSHFREECKKRIVNRNFGPDEFEQGMFPVCVFVPW